MRARDGVAVAVEREVVKLEVFRASDDEQGAATECGRGFKSSVVAVNVEIVSVGREIDFAGEFDGAGRECDCAGLRGECGAELVFRCGAEEKRGKDGEGK